MSRTGHDVQLPFEPADGWRMGVGLRRLLAPGVVRSWYQPIVRLDEGLAVGYEALARAPLAGGPADWLAGAEADGWRGDLERSCVEAAAANGAPPDGSLLFVNASPALLAAHDFAEVRRRLGPRLVIELTEQHAVDDYHLLRRHLQAWASDGVRLAIDDTGAGHSSLRHVLELCPDFLKLDRSLVHGVHRDRKLQALVRSMVAFAAELGSTVIAEGIEEPAELDELRRAGVHLGQGWLLAEPAPPWPVVASSFTGGTGSAPCRHAGEDGDLDVLLAAADDARTACEVACEHLRRHGELLPSAYLVRDGLLRCQAQRGYWQIMDGFPADVGLLGRCLATGERFAVGDVGTEPDFVAAVPGLVAEIVVPLRVDGAVVGVLSVESAVRIPVDAGALVDAVAAALERRLAIVGLPTSDSPLARLARRSRALAGVSDVVELRRLILETACDVGQTSSAMLAEPVDAALPGAGLVVAAVTGPLAPAFAAMDGPSLAMLAGSVDRVRSCYTADDPTGRTPSGSEMLRAAGARFVAVLPLVSLGRVRGVLVVADQARRAVSTDVIEALELLGAEAAQSLELAAVVAELRDRAASDPLTGLGNHSALHEALARSTGAGAAVVVADIDGFKPVNDTHGHLVGDDVLRSVGAAARRAVRAGDTLFRMGGDEFAAVLPAGGLAAGFDVAQRMRAAVAEVLGPYGADLSVGVAARGPGEAPTDWLLRADRALYSAKRGRTGVVAACDHDVVTVKTVVPAG